MFDDSIPADGLLVADNNLPYERGRCLVDKVCDVIRCEQYRVLTEDSYLDGMIPYINFDYKHLYLSLICLVKVMFLKHQYGVGFAS